MVVTKGGVIALPLVRWQSSCLSWLIRPTARLKPSGSTPAASHLPPRERARLHGVAVLLPRWQSSCLSLASRTSCLHTLHLCRGTAALSRLSALDKLLLSPVAVWNLCSASLFAAGFQVPAPFLFAAGFQVPAPFLFAAARHRVWMTPGMWCPQFAQYD
ncbi:unnamed protein product [Polarella glacialis]|uniref:Uncharacterized protein n=1 Tax=Polarella glacialis TaxID=89957 RepID=A0A813FIV7_POLGL|nr:unnamed protein product [Polarella glacialis]